jgi:hypothetical protein
MGVDDYLDDIRMAPTVEDREAAYYNMIRYLRHRSKVDRVVAGMCLVFALSFWAVSAYVCS